MKKIASLLLAWLLLFSSTAGAARDFTVQPVAPVEGTRPADFRIAYDRFKNGAKTNEVNLNLCFADAESYTDIAGVLTFRGNHMRQGNAYGTAQLKEKKLEKLWNFKIGSIDTWTGVGWNGQPSLVQWPETLRRSMNIFSAKAEKDGLIEGIYAALDGRIYFFDIEDGQKTREAITIGFPIKGSVSVDSRGYPLLYSGQGISLNNGRRGKIGYHIFSLMTGEKLFFLDGADKNRYRTHNSFDSVGLIDRNSDTLIIPGETGLFYALKLNTTYAKGKIAVNPTVYSYRYKSKITKEQGIENSVAMYGNYAYFADNSGLITCLNVNTLQPVWAQNGRDDTDSTIALEYEDNGRVALYTACEVDKQGSRGYSYIRRLNALTGEIEWEYKQACTNDGSSNGGALASPLVGKEKLSELVFFNICRTVGGGGKLFAFNKRSGRVVWEAKMPNYSWSSPVGIYNDDGEGYILLGDAAGVLRLYDGATGRVLDSVALGANIEGSPAVFDDIAVVGTRGRRIYGIRIR